jgi:EAL domain-containing protein (putative c-di-GMP-specific phosphodiesterase class I)
MDDFGTGYSSLNYLHRLPLDLLKIDRSFVNEMVNTEESLELVRAIISIARSMKMHVIAEGIETQEQAQLLQNLGCEFGQGFFFARPLDSHKALACLGV